MKKVKKALAAALALAMIAACDAAQAQRILNGVGSRLTGRGAPAVGLNQNEPVFEESAIPANPTVSGSSAMPGTTVAIPALQGAAQTAAQPAAKAPLKKSDGSEFVISTTATIEQLLEQANSLFAMEVAFETEEEYSAWISKMLETVVKICDRVLTMKPGDDDFIQTITLKGQALCYQSSIDSTVLPKLGNYANALEKNARVQSLDEGKQAAMAFKGVYLQAKVADVAEQNGSVAALTAAMKEVTAFVETHPETADMYVDLVFPVQLIAENQKDPTLVSKIWTPIRKQLAAGTEPEMKAALQLLEGTIRLSQLEGKAIKWLGVDASGKPLDKTKVEGKVVLVSFWASWHEQCAQVDTQLKQLYAKYHDRGFEIVGYNLDAEQENMDEYVTKNSIPWIILSDKAAADTKQTSLATYYGITEIPTMILVGGDGNVASVDISMESLIATLEAVFPESATGAAATGTSSARSTATGTTSSGTATAPSAGRVVNPASRSTAPTTIRSNGAGTTRVN